MSIETRTLFKIFLSSVFMLMTAGKVYGAGPCSALQPQGSCTASCNSSCSYYVMTPRTSTRTISAIPYALSPFKPGGNYCDLQGESQLDSVMNAIPFTLGPRRIARLPATVSLNYRSYVRRTINGPPCPVNTGGNSGRSTGSDDGGEWAYDSDGDGHLDTAGTPPPGFTGRTGKTNSGGISHSPRRGGSGGDDSGGGGGGGK